MHKDLKNCKNLDELLETLTGDDAHEEEPNPDDDNYLAKMTEWEQHDNGYKYGNDMCDLPNFGGIEPEDTLGIWSWDKKRILVGTGAEDFEIADRADFKLKGRYIMNKSGDDYFDKEITK